jgi:F-type H+-transporting ATPase subunit epsilon
MKVFILTPEKTIYEGEAISLQFYGKNSSFQLLDYHASMIAFVKEGDIQLYQDKSDKSDKSNKSIYNIKNGMIEVKNGMVKILL